MDKTSVMVCGHGSRDSDALREFELVAAGIKIRLPDCDIETGYLEFARPMIRDGLDALAARGAKRILALPGMLFAATHVKNDLPWELNSFMADNPGIEVKFGRDLAIDAKLLAAAAERIAAAELTARLVDETVAALARAEVQRIPLRFAVRDHERCPAVADLHTGLKNMLTLGLPKELRECVQFRDGEQSLETLFRGERVAERASSFASGIAMHRFAPRTTDFSHSGNSPPSPASGLR